MSTDKTISKFSAEVAKLEPVKVRAKRLDAKTRAAAKAKREAAAAAKKEAAAQKLEAKLAKMEMERVAKMTVDQVLAAVVAAAGAESRALVDFSRKLGLMYGFDWYTVPLTGSERGANVVARAKPIAELRTKLIDALKTEKSNAKGYVYWARLVAYAPRFDPAFKPDSNPDNGDAKPSIAKKTKDDVLRTWVRLNKSEAIAKDGAAKEKLMKISEHLEAALKLLGITDLVELRKLKGI